MNEEMKELYFLEIIRFSLLGSLSNVDVKISLSFTFLLFTCSYNNARIEDFQKVDDFMSNQQSKLEIGRMPWHDVHISMRGPSVLDVAHHFVERWNFVKRVSVEEGG